MIGLKTEFKSSSLAEWKDQLLKDLNGDDFSKLIKSNEIEEIEIPSFHHAESKKIIEQSPGKFPYTRSFSTSYNDWKNGFIIETKDASTANKKALDVLMKGCDHLIFTIDEKVEIDWKKLFNEIQFDYITANIAIRKLSHLKSLLAYFENTLPVSMNLDIDFIDSKNKSEENIEFIESLKGKSISFTKIDGYSVQQCGANTWQEIGFCLSTAHECFVNLLESGFTFEEAQKSIHFTIGIGSDFFYEIAKIRALRQTWSSILAEYDTVKNTSYSCKITAVIGFMNKSLADPYTNLLRQTTETLSAASGGADTIIVEPFDRLTDNGSKVFSERMALNVSLILKAESYISSVLDPMGGSYMIEELTMLIAEKAWNFFQHIEKIGGIKSPEAIEFMKNEISKKATQRLEEIQNNKRTLIGVNKFNNPITIDQQFLAPDNYLGMQKIIFERDLIKA